MRRLRPVGRVLLVVVALGCARGERPPQPSGGGEAAVVPLGRGLDELAAARRPPPDGPLTRGFERGREWRRIAARSDDWDERRRALERAAAVWGGLLAAFPDHGELPAEIAFRRGECLRTLGDEGSARGAFLECLDRAPAGSDWRMRALLELARSHRRLGEWRPALRTYGRALVEPGADLRRRNDAREEAVELLLELRSWLAALGLALEWRAHAEDPAEALRAEGAIHRALRGLGLVEAARLRLWAALGDASRQLARADGEEAEAARRRLARLRLRLADEAQ